MKRILKIGMDVHSTNYTLCAMEPVFGADDRIYATIQVSPDYKNILCIWRYSIWNRNIDGISDLETLNIFFISIGVYDYKSILQTEKTIGMIRAQ